MLSSFKVRKIALSWKMVGFRHKPDINPVNRGKNTNMWPLLNNSREFSVLKMKKKINAAVKRGTFLLLFCFEKEHTEKGINYDISRTLFRVCFEIFVRGSINTKLTNKRPLGVLR